MEIIGTRRRRDERGERGGAILEKREVLWTIERSRHVKTLRNEKKRLPDVRFPIQDNTRKWRKKEK